MNSSDTAGRESVIPRVLYHEYTGVGIGGSRHSLLNLILGMEGRVKAFLVANLPITIEQALPPDVRVWGPRLNLWPPTGEAMGAWRKTVRWWLHTVWMTLWLSSLVLRHRIDVVHANNDVTSNAPAILAAMLTGRPCVCHLRGNEPPWRETRWLFRHVDHYISISEHVRNFYAGQGLMNGCPDSVIYNGLDTRKTVLPEDGGARKHPGPFRIGLFGRMIEYKGHDFFIETAARTVRRRSDVDFVVHGPVPRLGDADWPYYDRLCQKRAQLGMDNHVRFAGAYTDVAEVMRDTDVVLCCSPYRNFERILMEAFACGVPVVAFDSGGTREVAVSGKNCLLAPNRDTGAMAEAVRRLIADPSLREELARGGRETAGRLFDHRANAEKVLEIYQGLLASRKRKRRPAARLHDEYGA